MTSLAPSSRPPRTISLTARLIGAIILILLAGGLMVTLAAFAYGHQAARTAFDRLLIGAANQISASISIVEGEPLVDLPVPALELLALAEEDRIVYRVLGTTSETLTGYDSLAVPDLHDNVTYFDGEFTGEPARFVAVRRHFAERGFSGTVTTAVGQTTRARDALAWDIARNAWLVLALAGVGMAALAAFSVQSALAPLRRIESRLLRRDPKDLTPLEITVPGELRAIVDAINRFMARIKRQVDGVQNLISDSAHQLRTPITALRAQAELAAEESDPSRQAEIIKRVHARSIELSRLTDQLLNRALVIHRADSAVHARTDLRKVAMDASEAFNDGQVFEEGKLRLDMPPAPALVNGDALSLTEAAKNLIGNALKHGTYPVTVRVTANGRDVTLTVHDCGTGPTDEVLSALGRRFLRSGDGGSGLGLSIAGAVARAHRTELAILARTEAGFEVGFTLPVIDGQGADE